MNSRKNIFSNLKRSSGGIFKEFLDPMIFSKASPEETLTRILVAITEEKPGRTRDLQDEFMVYIEAESLGYESGGIPGQIWTTDFLRF